jgi:hypothetical protein
VGTLRGSLGCDSPPKSVSKGAQFWGFPCSRVCGALGGISSIPPFWTSFGGIKLVYCRAYTPGTTRKEAGRLLVEFLCTPTRTRAM